MTSLIKPAPLFALAFALAIAQQDASAQADPANKSPQAKFSTCDKPEWPKTALRYGQQGAVSLSFLIGVDGKAVKSKIDHSSGFPLLDYAALATMSACRFEPAIKEGRPQQAWMKMQYVWMFDNGSSRESVDWPQMEEKAALGDTAAEYRLALHLQDGRNAKRNPEEAIRLLRSASAKSHVPSQLALAHLLSTYAERDKHRDEVMDLYDKAAALGSARAKYMLAAMLVERPNDVNALSDAEAAFRSAALQKYPSALAPLGVLLVQTADADKQAEGVAILRRAADQFDPIAQGELGTLFEKGLGVPQDYDKAASLYVKAIRGGYVKVQPALARLYDAGLGVSKDPEKAAKLRQAVALWNEQAN